jgi:Flp pilus assembly protein TadD
MNSHPPEQHELPPSTCYVTASTVQRGSRRSRASVLAGGALVSMVLVVYLPLVRAGFIIDDFRNLSANPTLRSPDGLRQIWFAPGSVQQYYPLVYTMHWVECRIWGFGPLGYHLVNVLLHATNVLLVWFVLARLKLPGAWLAAAIFAVHPIEVETVAWISERKNVLSLGCALASLLCFLHFEPTDESESGRTTSARRWYVASLVWFAAALMSKTVVVTLPAVLLVIYWWKRGRVATRDVTRLLPFFLLAIGLGSLGLWLETHHVHAQGADWSLTFVERLLVAGRAIWFHLGKLVWPYPLMFFYPRWFVDRSEWWQYLFPLAAIGAPVALWAARYRIGRGSLTAVLIYAGVLMPALGFLNVYFHLFSYVADHFQYHASPAMFALAAAGITTALSHYAAGSSSAQLASWPAIGRVAVAALLLILALLSVRATAPFSDEKILYRDVIAKNPASWTAYSNLGALLRDEGRFDEADDAMREALRLAPAKYQVAYNYAMLVMARGEKNGFQPGELDDAIAHFGQAARSSPHRSEPYVGAGVALIRANRLAEAAVSLDRAIEIDPNNVSALYVRGLVAAEHGQTAQAQRMFEGALRLDPNRPEIHFSLGLILAAQGQLPAAAYQYSQAVRLRPGYVAAWNNLAATQAKLGQFDRAVESFRKVVHLQPHSPEAQANLTTALEQQRQGAKQK